MPPCPRSTCSRPDRRSANIFRRISPPSFRGSRGCGRELSDLAESLAQAAEAQPGVYVVFAEDLAEGVDIEAGLIQSFGAEIGDEVVVVRPNRNMAVVQVERRRIGYHSRAA